VVRTDRDKLKHILQNLITNALKFTEVGQVAVSARHMAGGNRIESSVFDTEIGIAPQDLGSIFQKFGQLDASKTRSHGGVGLGLHIVKTFSEILGGTVTVTSQPGNGSTFAVTLPCVYEGSGTTRMYPRKRAGAEPNPSIRSVRLNSTSTTTGPPLLNFSFS
jgi:signal transduction histidine kinase